jgi:hypothetical protein
MYLAWLQFFADTYYKQLDGFWMVSDQFKQEAGLDQLILYFSKEDHTTGGKRYTHKGYVILVVDKETVMNEPVSFNISLNRGGATDSSTKTYTINFSKSTKHMPASLNMSLDPAKGSIILKCPKTKKMYGLLFKDNQLSAKSLLKVDAEPITV